MTSKRTAPNIAAICCSRIGNGLISLLLPCLEWPGHRPLKLVWTQNGLCRQMKLRCQCHTGCLTSRPRQMKLRWRTHPSFGPSLRLLGLHLNPHPVGHPSALIEHTSSPPAVGGVCVKPSRWRAGSVLSSLGKTSRCWLFAEGCCRALVVTCHSQNNLIAQALFPFKLTCLTLSTSSQVSL